MSIYEQMHIKPDDTGTAELNWRRKPRRKFTQAERMAIVKECLVPGASVAEVAQRNQVNANLLFNWKRKHAGEALPAPAKSAALVAFPHPDGHFR